MIKIFNYKLILIFLFSLCNLQSQDTSAFQNEIFAIHPKGGLLGTYFQSDFTEFEGTATGCPTFKSGFGYGLTGFLQFEFPLTNDLFLSLGAGYIDRSGKLTIDYTFPSRSETKVVNVKYENSIDVKLRYIDIQGEIRFNLIDEFISGPLRSITSVRYGIPLKPSFTQKERIVSPENAVFILPNDKRVQERLLAEGDLASFNKEVIGISVGFENMLQISKYNFLTQQILFDYNLTNVVTDADWRLYGLRFELGARFSIQSNPALPSEEIETPDSSWYYERKEEVKPMPIIDIAIRDVNFELHTGNELLASAPIVNAVFFQRNSDIIPDLYELNKQQNLSWFLQDPVEVHKYLLPRIAEIVNKNPLSKVVLEGSTAGKDYELEGLRLALNRIDKVKDALIRLGVPEVKITKAPGMQPRYPSNQEFDKGVEENQRVDIVVKNAPLQEYVNIQKFAELNGTFNVAAEFKNCGDSIELASNVSDEKTSIKNPGIYSFDAKKRLNNIRDTFILKTTAYCLDTSDSDELFIDVSELNKKQIELNVDNFEAVLRFDYNSSELSEDNKGLLKQLAELLAAGRTIIIYGSTDALGTEKRNIQLERERANVTEQYIKSVSGSKFIIRKDSGIKKYSEETPQGRFLNRCIRIKVK